MGRGRQVRRRAAPEPRVSDPIRGSFHDFKLPNSGVYLPWASFFFFFFSSLFAWPPTPLLRGQLGLRDGVPRSRGLHSTCPSQRSWRKTKAKAPSAYVGKEGNTARLGFRPTPLAQELPGQTWPGFVFSEFDFSETP